MESGMSPNFSGNLTTTLKDQGLWNDTLLIITADNGGIGR
jgi:arylsulfatase A-like enzyme